MGKTRPHWSPSQLAMLGRCPKQWEFRYVRGMKMPPGTALLKGAGVDKAAEVNYTQKIASGRDLPESDLVDAAAAEFEARKRSEGYSLTAEEEAIGAQKVLGQTLDATVSMAKFWSKHTAPLYQPASVQQYFKIPLQGPRDLVGYWDWTTTTGVLVDQKTSSKKKTQADVDADMQFTVYAAAFQRLNDAPPAAIVVENLIHSKAGNQSRQAVSTRRSPDSFVILANRINAANRTVATGNFPPITEGWWCSANWCGYHRICPFYSGEKQ